MGKPCWEHPKWGQEPNPAVLGMLWDNPAFFSPFSGAEELDLGKFGFLNGARSQNQPGWKRFGIIRDNLELDLGKF